MRAIDQAFLVVQRALLSCRIVSSIDNAHAVNFTEQGSNVLHHGETRIWIQRKRQGAIALSLKRSSKMWL
jgi:hypothetical protein